MARSALLAEAALRSAPQDAFYLARLQTARFYGAQLLPQAAALAAVVRSGAACVVEARTDLL
jgi:hypothetical protein